MTQPTSAGAAPLRIWLLAVGEPLPTDPGTPRLLRVGQLASQMAGLGLDVTWWTAAFDHTQKRTRQPLGAEATAGLGYALRLLPGEPYRSNVSLQRIRHHRQVAAAFAATAPAVPRPDLIFCAYPTIELCEAALDYARPLGIPVVVDIRDLWPDIFANLAPQLLRPAARLALMPMHRASQRVCAGAAAITGITEAFVDWGVQRAGRERRADDRAYPLAYHADLPPPQALQAADEAWMQRGLGPDRPIACFFGTLGRQFDIPMLIDAARRLADTPIRIVVCGAGDRLAEYRQMARGVPQIEFPGWVDAAAIRSLMSRSLVGVAPYRCERSFTLSIPNKAIEYLAGGLPILSTLSGELQGLLAGQDCGITTPDGDAAALAAALRGLMADPGGVRRMADNARRTFHSQFVASAVYGRLIEHLTGLATRPRRSPAAGPADRMDASPSSP